MKRISALICLLLLLPITGFARAKLQGYVEQGNTTLAISGGIGAIPKKVQGSFPGATVTIYVTGGITSPSACYADNSGTVKPCSFTSSADGSWYVYLDDGRYDVRFSGTGITTPFTLGDFLLSDSSINTCINAQSLGADNTGATSASAKIQSAINSAATPGARVCIPAGTYKITSTLTISKSIWLDGAFSPSKIVGSYDPLRGTILQSAITDGTPVIKIIGDDTRAPGFFEDNGTKITNINIQGNGAEGDGILYSLNGYIIQDHFENLHIYGVGGSGIADDGTHYGHNYSAYKQISVWNAGKDGITFTGGTRGVATGTKIAESWFSQCARNAIRLTNLTLFTIENVNENTTGADAIYLDNADSCVFNNVITEDNTGYGLYMTNNSTQNVFYGGGFFRGLAGCANLTDGVDNQFYGVHFDKNAAATYQIILGAGSRKNLFDGNVYYETRAISDGGTVPSTFRHEWDMSTYPSMPDFYKSGTKGFGIGIAPADYTVLDLGSSTNNQGFRVPGLTTAQATALQNSAPTGAEIRNTATNQKLLKGLRKWTYVDTNRTINPYSLGAVADGLTHPLSTYYATLADAQVDYSFATALTQETDWAAIQLCVNNATTLNGTCYMPPGAYYISDSIVITGSINLEGPAIDALGGSGGATIQSYVVGAAPVISVYGFGTPHSVQGVKIRNLIIVGHGAEGNGIGFTSNGNVYDSIIENLKISSVGGSGVGSTADNTNFGRNTFRNIKVYSPGLHGFYFTTAAAGGYTLGGSIIENSHVQSAGGDGYFLDTFSGMSIRNSMSIGSTSAGLHLVSTHYNLFENLNLGTSGTNGMNLNSIADCTFISNLLSANVGTQIALASATENTFIDTNINASGGVSHMTFDASSRRNIWHHTRYFQALNITDAGTQNLRFQDVLLSTGTLYPGVQTYNGGTTTTYTPVNITPTTIIHSGTVALASASPSVATITGFSPAFSNATSYVCTATPEGNTAVIADKGIAVIRASGSSIVLTGPDTVTTVVHYICIGN